MISCHKATELISKSMEEPLGLKEELALKFHLFLCECCEQFRKQLFVLRSMFESFPEVLAHSLNQRAKERISAALKNER